MRFRKEEEDDFSLDMTPMIDVVFLLIIFFMVSTAFVDFTKRMDISLPSAKSAVPDDIPKSLTIEMTLDRFLFVNGEKITPEGFSHFLQTFQANSSTRAIIKADKGLPYGNVVEVMGILQAAKINDISVAVK